MRLPKTKILTVDIFDTLLMRKTYPEARQFQLWAARACGVVGQHLPATPSAYQLYTLRERARGVINQAYRVEGKPTEPRLADIFEIVAGELQRANGVPVTDVLTATLVAVLTETELAVERDHLTPNTPLVDEIRRVKAGGVAVYFLSDMYLSTANITALLEGFGVADAFDGGLSSSDAGGGKYSGDLFRAFRQQFYNGNLDWADVTHIGDNVSADVVAAQALGINAIHYHTNHHRARRVKMVLGGRAVRRWARRERAALTRAVREAVREAERGDPLDAYATVMALGLIYYGGTLNLLANRLGAPIWYISGEGEALRHVSERVGWDTSAAYVLPKLNRKRTMRAYAGAAARKPGFSAWEKLLPLFNIGGLDFDTATFLGALDLHPHDLGLTALTLRHVSVDDAVGMILTNEALLARARAMFAAAREEVRGWLRDAGLGDTERVILADVGWSATIQTLLEHTLALEGDRTAPYGVYLGYTGAPIFEGVRVPDTRYGVLFNGLLHRDTVTWNVEEVWEYMLTEYPRRAELPDLDRFWRVFETTLALTHETDGWVDTEVVFLAALPEFKRLFAAPTRAQAGRFAFLDHDIGFGTTEIRPLVNRSLRTRTVWLKLANPLVFYRLLRVQFWRAGFLAWYRLRWLQRPFAWGMRLLARAKGRA